MGASGSRHRVLSNGILWVWGGCIRYVTPVALGIAIINSLITEFSTPYEGYPVSGILILGVGWLLVTHIAALVLAARPWKRPLTAE